MDEAISVLLPVHRWHGGIEPAIRSILDQTHSQFELLLIINGTNETLHAKIGTLKALDARIRIIRVDRMNLATALNAGLAHAQHQLIARMDADDLSHPSRFRWQLDYLNANPDIAGCGTGATFINREGAISDVVIPPLTHQEARWRLMIWNPFVHGSMMLRKQHADQAGGYNENLERSQDYDLWMRLRIPGLGGIHNIAYTHKDSQRNSTLDPMQSVVTADLLIRHWSDIKSGHGAVAQEAIAKIACGDDSGRLDLEHAMETLGPTQELLTAWMWSHWRSPAKITNTPMRLARLAYVSESLRESQIFCVWIWGAGDLGKFIVAHQHLLGVKILGVLDDTRHGQRLGNYVICDPCTLDASSMNRTHIIIASELYEEAIWDRTLPMRQGGAHVIRMTVPTPSQQAISCHDAQVQNRSL